MGNDLTRTTIRLPKDVHEMLKDVASKLDETAEALIARSLRETLPKLSFHLRVEHPVGWGEILALRFVQFMPAPFVIKGRDESVIYANPAYEHEFGVNLAQLRGKQITDFGFLSFQRGQLHNDFKEVVETEAPRHFIEAMTLQNRMTIPYQVIRYVFNTLDAHYVGDFSFRWATVYATDEDRQGLSTDQLCEAILNAHPHLDIARLVVPALEKAPLSIVIKDAESMRTVWCNATFVDLAKKVRKGVQTKDDLIGRTTKEIWGLSDHHPIVLNDAAVVHAKKGDYFNERLTTASRFRTSLRFPILGKEGKVRFLGVVSPNFQLSGFPGERLEVETSGQSEV